MDATKIDISEVKRILPQTYGIGGANTAAQNAIQRQNAQNAPNKSFADVLNDKITDISFTKHANARLRSRDINLTDEQLDRVQNGVSKARAQGVRDSLVLVDEYALVVDVRRGAVVTAVNPFSSDRSVFTNIDGAVIV